MQRTRTVSWLLLAALCASGAGARAQSGDPGQGEPPPVFDHTFGAPGERGSYRVQFDEHGAGVVFLQMMDEFVDAAAGRNGAHRPGDYLLLLYAGGDYSFSVAESGDQSLFPMNLSTARWQHAVEDGAVRFWIESDGLRLSKIFSHSPEQRGLIWELRLENLGRETVPPTALFELGGPCLFSQPELMLFTSPAIAIGTAAGGAPVHLVPQPGVRQPLLALEGADLSMAGTTNRFFGGFLHPLDDATSRALQRIDVVALPRQDLRVPLGGGDPPEMAVVEAGSQPQLRIAARLDVPPPGGASSLSLGCYLGPKSYRVFGEQPEFARYLPIMDVDLEPPCCGGIVVPGGRFMASTLLRLLGWFESVVGNWGIAIMMLTILVRGALAPLNFRMQKSMRAFGARMAVLKPKMDEIKRRHADDPKAYQQAMLQFNRENKIIPPIGGCLPIFLTMPVYIGLFTALRTAYDLRQEPFVLWIDDLSRPDALVDLGIPLVHNLNVLPLLWIGLLITLQLRMPLPTDPQQRQVQQMMRYMPMIFGVLLYNYASGLMLYMVTSMVWTFGESAAIKKILGPMDPNAAGVVPTPVL